MNKEKIIDHLLNLLNDARYYNGSHHSMLKELSEKYNTTETEIIELYRQAQQIWKEQNPKDS